MYLRIINLLNIISLNGIIIKKYYVPTVTICCQIDNSKYDNAPYDKSLGINYLGPLVNHVAEIPSGRTNTMLLSINYLHFIYFFTG